MIYENVCAGNGYPFLTAFIIHYHFGRSFSCNTDDTSFVYDTTVSVRRPGYGIQIIDR